MNRLCVTALVLAGLLATGCASATPTPSNGSSEKPYDLRQVGEHFETDDGGSFVLIRVQDEYRLLYCIQDGPIAGCYAEAFTVERNSVPWSDWVDVESQPGLRLAFLSPVEFAVRYEPEPAPIR